MGFGTLGRSSNHGATINDNRQEERPSTTTTFPDFLFMKRNSNHQRKSHSKAVKEQPTAASQRSLARITSSIPSSFPSFLFLKRQEQQSAEANPPTSGSEQDRKKDKKKKKKSKSKKKSSSKKSSSSSKARKESEKARTDDNDPAADNDDNHPGEGRQSFLGVLEKLMRTQSGKELVSNLAKESIAKSSEKHHKKKSRHHHKSKNKSKSKEKHNTSLSGAPPDNVPKPSVICASELSTTERTEESHYFDWKLYRLQQNCSQLTPRTHCYE